MRRKTWAVAALAMVVVSAGCGGTRSSGGTTSAATPTGIGNNGGNGTATTREKAVKFGECIRANGVGAFPDPDASGAFPTAGISVSRAVWDKALRACKELQPAGSLSVKRSAEQQSAALKFAQCMRENGVKDFPDPANGERLVDLTRLRTQIPSSGTPGGMSILHAAMEKCAVTPWERQWGG
jgi:hypothetical protein